MIIDWSEAKYAGQNTMVSLGLGAVFAWAAVEGAEVVPDKPGLEWKASGKLEWATEGRVHYAAAGKLNWSAPAED